MNATQKEMLRERARDALRDLYHNATLTFPRDLRGRSEDYFQNWLADACQWEVEYIGEGGAYGADYLKTLRAECNAGRYKSEQARAYYVRAGMRAMREERAKYAAWEEVSHYGPLYQWGRGGRTLAPADLIRPGGGSSFSIREDYADDLNAAQLTEFVRFLESFNCYVGQWCKGVPAMWDEHCADEDANALRQKRADAARKAKETRERNYWAARGVLTEGAPC